MDDGISPPTKYASAAARYRSIPQQRHQSRVSIEAFSGVIIDITTADKGFNCPSISGDGTAVVTVNGEYRNKLNKISGEPLCGFP